MRSTGVVNLRLWAERRFAVRAMMLLACGLAGCGSADDDGQPALGAAGAPMQSPVMGGGSGGAGSTAGSLAPAPAAGAGASAPQVAGANAPVLGAGAGGMAGALPAAGGGGTAAPAPDAGAPAADCDRTCLSALNTEYLEALAARDASRLPTAANVRFTENGAELPLTGGLWAVAESLSGYRQDFAEVAAGQSASFAALTDASGPVLLAARLKVVNREITEIETIVARRGEATFFSPQNLTMADPIFDAEIPMAQRQTRERLIEIVDLYFQGLDVGDGSKVPFAAQASRNENGVVTASGASISNLSAFSYIDEITRRYVLVDVERGVALPFVLFQIPNGLTGSRTLHLAELFKVDGSGEIAAILAIMVNRPLGTPSGWE
jgi:hypothetical protein